jgi:ligand-binding sensor domain-containing protein
LPDNNIRSIAIDGSGNKWIGTYRGGLAKFDGSTWTVYDVSNSGIISNSIISVAVEGNNKIWVGSSPGGMASFDGTNWTIYGSSGPGTLPFGAVYAISIDNAGNKWIAIYLDGLVKFDGTTWTNYTQINSGLTDSYVNTVAVDGNGNKWTGTTYAGIAVFNENGILVSNGEKPVSGQFVSIYPNPADDYLYIESNASVCIDRVEFLSMTGNLVKTGKLMNGQSEISIRELPAGVYLLRVYTDHGVESKKLIINSPPD